MFFLRWVFVVGLKKTAFEEKGKSGQGSSSPRPVSGLIIET
jgi:hypothetical protein